MSQLGDRLRAARESQGIGLAQAAVETRILQRYLVALEDGDFQHLPGDVYARGFIRNYGAYLGLSPEELIEFYRRERGMSEPIRVVPATSAPRIRGFALPSFFGVFFVVLALIGLFYLGLSTTNQIGGSAQPQAVNLPTAAPTPPPLPTAPPDATNLPESVTGAPPAPTSAVLAAAGGTSAATPTAAPTASDAPIVGEVRIAGGENPGSWLSIRQDGAVVFAKTLGSGQSFPLRAQRSISIRAGNAGVVTVVVNGQELCCTDARSGEVRTVSWPP
ncbi:MAG: helix-turn-helix domain-containing protein [Roseiflexaceae bacterium]